MYRRLSSLFLLLALLLSAGFIAPTFAVAAPSTASQPLFSSIPMVVSMMLPRFALLLRAPSASLVGVSTVVGNTSVDNATKNVLTILDLAGRNVPVTVGASQPRAFPVSKVGWFIHGPDGLWFAQKPHDIANLPHDAPAAIAAAARANPSMTLLALGPLTNVAAAVERYPQDMAKVTIVALGGAKVGGNRTPVAEANVYNDPQAFDVVVKAHLKLTLVTLDAFSQVQLDATRFVQLLSKSRDPLFAFLAAPIGAYANGQTNGAGGPMTIPDVIAAIYVLKPQIATPAGAVVMVQTDGGTTRGQTVMATDPYQKVLMIASDGELSALAEAVFTGQVADMNAEIGKILARHPDDAQVVVSLNIRENARNVVEALFN